MLKPKHIYYTMNGTKINIPHDIFIDNLRNGEYKQIEFDSRELDHVKGCAIETDDTDDVKDIDSVGTTVDTVVDGCGKYSTDTLFVDIESNYHPYSYYSEEELYLNSNSDLDSDSNSNSEYDSESEYEYTDEKTEYITHGSILPLPVTSYRKPQEDKLSNLSKVLLVLITLMLISIINHFCASLSPSFTISLNCLTTSELTVPELTPEYKHTARLNELYHSYNL